MKLPYMPFWVGDWLADTTHLNAEESGAYLHLVLHYWASDGAGLPDDDKALARIARVSDKDWKRIRMVLRPFFKHGWKHSRVEREYEKALAKHEKRSKAGTKGNAARWRSQNAPDGIAMGSQSDRNATPATPSQSDRNAIAKPSDGDRSQSQSHNHKKIDDDDAGAAGRAAVALVSELAGICGIGEAEQLPIGWFGAPMRVAGWLREWPKEVILASVRRQMANRSAPPNTVSFFEKGIAEDIARAAAPLPVAKVIPMEVVHVHQKPDRIGEAAQRLIDRFGPEDDAAPVQDLRGEADRGAAEILPPRKAE